MIIGRLVYAVYGEQKGHVNEVRPDLWSASPGRPSLVSLFRPEASLRQKPRPDHCSLLGVPATTRNSSSRSHGNTTKTMAQEQYNTTKKQC